MEEAFKLSIGYRPSRLSWAMSWNDGTLSILYSVIFLIALFVLTPFLASFFEVILGTRCIVPNNYLVWEATRPLSDCDFCRGVQSPIILSNCSREEFKPYAYSSRPIIIKNAVSHWPAAQFLNFTYLKDLYQKHPAALDSFHEDCQFLHFKSNFQTLRDVFRMSEDFRTGHKPWYVGWSNCNPVILAELRKLYPKPHFLPEDAEMPNTDFVFLGYEQGALMHVRTCQKWCQKCHSKIPTSRSTTSRGSCGRPSCAATKRGSWHRPRSATTSARASAFTWNRGTRCSWIRASGTTERSSRRGSFR